MTSTNLRHWLSRGELEKLENVVLEGRGSRLLGEHSPDLRTRVFLKGLPNYLTKISQTHDAVVRGSLTELIRLVEGEPKKKLVCAKDPAGTPLIHKAVYYDHQNVLEWIVNNYPTTVEQKDREGRTALHYCGACRDPDAAWDALIGAGCDASVCDRRSHPAAYYLQHGAEVELPDVDRMANRRRRYIRDTSKWTGSLDFKPSNIRIWIHNRDIGKLQHVLWEGHGSKLRCETSHNARVKIFLEAVPFIMGTIKEIHMATIKNDIESFRNKIDEPVSPIILSSKDSNGLNVLHKAAGLGYVEFTKEILERYPTIVNSVDNEGKTPLHYAAVCRDGGVMYDLLLENGADENKIDNRHKTASYYKNRPADVDLTSLVMVPEAPRVSGTSYPRHWDWRIIDSELPLPRMKRKTNTGEDSAFGSAESAKLQEELATPEMENAEEDAHENAATEEDAEEAEGKEEENGLAEGDGDAAENAENADNETAADDEDKSPDEEEEPPADVNAENPEEDSPEAPEESDEPPADDNNNSNEEPNEAEAETTEDAPAESADEAPPAEEQEAEADGETEAQPDEVAQEAEDSPENAEAAQEVDVEPDEAAQEVEESPEDAEAEATDPTEAEELAPAADEVEAEEEEPPAEGEQEEGETEEADAEAEEDEKPEPSTADSGLGDTPNDEEQVRGAEKSA